MSQIMLMVLKYIVGEDLKSGQTPAEPLPSIIAIDQYSSRTIK